MLSLKFEFSAIDKISRTFHITLISIMKRHAPFRLVFKSKYSKTSYKVLIYFLCDLGHRIKTVTLVLCIDFVAFI